MGKQTLLITIVAHRPYIRFSEGADEGRAFMLMEPYFAALSDTYLPLLRVFSRLAGDGVPFRLSMVFSPALCALFTDRAVQEAYARYLERAIAFGEAEAASHPFDSPRGALARRYLQQAEDNLAQSATEYHGNILAPFRYFVDRGFIEPLATCGTFAFLPHYAELTEAMNAQIESGLVSHREHFGTAADGFWLPWMGYSPRSERALRSYGVNYTALEAHGALFARPVPHDGLFSPVRSASGLAFFARDWLSWAETAGPDGFASRPEYRNQKRDAVFEDGAGAADAPLFAADGNARVPSGCRYWARSGAFYNPEEARLRAEADAREFLRGKLRRLADAARLTRSGDASLFLAYRANVFGGLWHEGPQWLEALFREGARAGAEFSTCLPLLDNQSSFEKTEPYPSASSGSGYGEDLLDASNARFMRYVRKATERMIELAGRFPAERGIRARTLNLAAQEALLAQASDWPRMLNRGVSPAYAEERLTGHVLAFTRIFESFGANSPDTEWFTKREKEYPLFPRLNYRIFAEKRN